MRMKTKQFAILCEQAAEHPTGSKESVEYLIEYHDYGQVVAFPGTEITSIVDVMRDLWAWAKWKNKDGFHSGCYDGWAAVRDDIYEQLDLDSPIYFTGFSLGGGIAICAAVDHFRRYQVGVGLYTFNAPRVLINGRQYANLFSECVITQDVADPISGLLKWSRYEHPRDDFIRGNKRLHMWKRKLTRHYIKSVIKGL